MTLLAVDRSSSPLRLRSVRWTAVRVSSLFGEEVETSAMATPIHVGANRVYLLPLHRHIHNIADAYLERAVRDCFSRGYRMDAPQSYLWPAAERGRLPVAKNDRIVEANAWS